jgi:hypothetical protein
MQAKAADGTINRRTAINIQTSHCKTATVLLANWHWPAVMQCNGARVAFFGAGIRVQLPAGIAMSMAQCIPRKADAVQGDRQCWHQRGQMWTAGSLQPPKLRPS